MTGRYDNARRLQVRMADGTIKAMTAPRVAPAPPTRGTYTTKVGERLDLISEAALGDSKLWWVLADANRWWDATRIDEPGTEMELPDA